MKISIPKGALALIFAASSAACFAQNVGINITGATPSINAILDLNTGNSYNLGLIIPRVTLGASLTTFSPPILNAVTTLDTDMIVYNIGGPQSVGYYYWNGSTWVSMAGLPPLVTGANDGTSLNGTTVILGNAFGGTLGKLLQNTEIPFNGNNLTFSTGGLGGGNMGIDLAANTSAAQALEIGQTTNTIRVNGLTAGATYNIANGSAPLTSYLMFANATGDLNAMAAGAPGNALIWTPSGPSWGNAVTLSTAWQILGNSNIVDGTNFLGTTNTSPINFQINGNTAGRIDMNKLNTFLGYQTTPIATTGTNNAAFGNNALTANLGGSSNTAVGSSALTNNTASQNVAVGASALTANTSGTSNTAVGYLALSTNTTNSSNTALGYEASRTVTGAGNTGIGYEPLFNATTGSFNSAVGYLPMGSGLLTGTGNSGIGYEPLFKATSGSYNFAGGYWAMGNGITTGFYNTGLGYEALYNISSGYYNVGIGYLSLLNTTSAFSNVGIGYEALELTSTNGYNNAIGYLAQYDNTAGYYNNAMGYEAGALNFGGYYNNAQGYFAMYQNNSGFYNNALGYFALYGGIFGQIGTGNNAIGYEAMYESYSGSYNNAMGEFALLGNYSGYYNNAIGYGALYGVPGSTSGYYNNAMGYYALHALTTGYYNNAFGYEALYSNTTGGRNVGEGFEALYSNTGGSSNVGVGDSALYANTTGSFNTAVGYKANVNAGNLVNATAIGNGATAGASNSVVLGNNAVTATEFSGALMPYYGAVYNAGTAGQVLTSQGAGVAPQWASGVAGANNGLSVNGGNVQLGGPLIQNTSVTANNNNMNFDLGNGATAGTGSFTVTNGGFANPYLTVVNSGNAGNTGQVGIGTLVPNGSAVLDVNSTKAGLLFPRMDSAQVLAIPAPASGLVVFNTSSNCLQLFAGMWVNIACGCTPLAAPGPISGPQLFCGAAIGQTYTCGAVVGAVSYVWTISPTVPGTSISGTGTTATVTFAATPTTYTISVADINVSNCVSGYTTYTVVVSSAPAAPGNITGPLSPLINSNGNVYSIAPVAGATGYMWTIVPAGATITAGQGSTSITVSFGPSVTTYTMCVYDSNAYCKSPVGPCLTFTTSACTPGVVRDASVTAVASATTWTITTTHANDVIMIAADGWNGPLSNAPGTVTVNGSNATFIQLGYNAPANTSDASIWAFAAAVPGTYTIVCTETGLNNPYYLNFAAAYYGNCTPINVSNVTPSGNSFAATGTESETITTTMPNSYIFGSFSFNYCVGGNPTLTGITQLGAEIFVACGINSCQADVLEAAAGTYTITGNDGNAQGAMSLAVIHP